MSQSNNRRIAKNTLYMYFRMFVTLGLSLYTSRIVLKTLGVEDYGLYNVVGGIVAMFGFINGAMINTTSRYITYYLGKNNSKALNNVFSITFIIHLFIALIVLLLGETIGLWYFYEKLVIPDGRQNAALWLYQLSIASAIANIVYVPYNATIIAHEKMNSFAYISILDAFLKLAIALCLIVSPYDKLIFYGCLMFLISLLNVLIYYIYCRTKFSETAFHWFWEKNIVKEMFSFAGWSLFGNFSYLFYSQGINLVLNAFCGPVVNAARGIAVQVEGVIRTFASNIQTAVNPQIIKAYAESEKERFFSLVYMSSKYCFFLLFLLALPIIIETHLILSLWLGDVPDHTVNFVRIILVMTLLDGWSNPLFISNLATGKVRTYQITLSAISYLLMPVTYYALKYTNIPEVVFLCVFVCKILEQIARIYIAHSQIGLVIKQYLIKVVLPNLMVCFISSIIPIASYLMLSRTLTNSLFIMALSVVSVFFFVYAFGMTQAERIMAKKMIGNKFGFIFHN